MNILILPDPGRSFNAVRPEAEIYIGLKNKGHQVIVVTTPKSSYYELYQKAGLKVLPFHSGKKVDLVVIKQLRKIIKDHHIDIVYATKSRTIPNAAFACIGSKAKMIAYRGTTGGLYKTDPMNYISLFHPRINGIVCVSRTVEKYVKPKVNRKVITKTIYKGHDISWYDKPKVDLTSLSANGDFFNVLCIGSARSYKGMEYMIEAAKYINHLEKLQIILVGDGFNIEPFQSAIRDSGMADRIIQPGFRADVPQIAAACDVLVLPSLREGLPRVVLESLASNTPVISSANDGAKEIIEEGNNGFIVPLKDGKAIAEKIIDLYNDPALLAELTKNAQSIFSSKMSHQKTVDEYESFFQSFLA